MRTSTTALWRFFSLLLLSDGKHDTSGLHSLPRVALLLFLALGVVLASGCDSAGPASGSNTDGFRPYEAGLTGVWGSASSIADLDGDGNQDLIIVGGRTDGSPSATLYLGNGDGTFSADSAAFSGVEHFSSTSVADVNEDGTPDVLITGEDERNLPIPTLYLGNGNGAFTTAEAGLEGGEGGTSSIADMNGDGHLDLLITGRTDNQIVDTKLYLGNGDGTFSETDTGLPDLEFGAHSIADVNGDDHLDILLTGQDTENDNNRIAALFLGDGTGDFSPAGAGLTGVSLSSTSIADVNEDGNADLLIAGFDGDAPTTTLYLGDGTGNFSPADAGLPDLSSASTAIADVDGDGNQDLLLSGENENGNPTTMLYLGDGDGNFSPADVELKDLQDGSISIADVDGDQDLDVLITGHEYLDSPEEELVAETILYENLGL